MDLLACLLLHFMGVVTTDDGIAIPLIRQAIIRFVSRAVLAVTLVVAVWTRAEGAAIITAKSVSQADVATAVSLAVDGDTVVIPPGTATWTTILSISKAIKLQGSGTGVTIIKDGVQNGRFLNWTLVAGKPSRMTGIEFQDGGRTNRSWAPTGVFGVTGSNTNGSTFRWDNCKWTDLNGYPVFETVIGVIDHNTFTIGNKQNIGFYFYDSLWDGQNYGDGSWAAASGFGSSQFLFIEDNTFTNTSTVYLLPMTDAYAGARFVVRNNSIYNANIQNHGTESTGRVRGGRAVEVYNNTFTGTNINNIAGDVRSGVVLFHDNTFSGYSNAYFLLQCHRMFYPFTPWDGADGTNQWDLNQAGGPFFSGAASAASSGLTVTVSGVSWTTNQWAGYSVRRTTNLSNAAGPSFGEIESNTANALTFTNSGGYAGGNLTLVNGDSLGISKVNQALDQPGRARGSLISGSSPSRPSRWNDQVTEPCYSWNNRREGGVAVNLQTGVKVIRSGEHYYNATQAPGYTTYTYPHPLVTGAPAAPPAPKRLRRAP